MSPRFILGKSVTISLRQHQPSRSHQVFAAAKCGSVMSRTIITLRMENTQGDSATYQPSHLETEPRENETQLLFGANVIRAALVAKKRHFKQLYTFGDDPAKRSILDLAKKLDVDVVEAENRGVLNNLSGNRPHNGFVLECSIPDETVVSCLGPKSRTWQPLLENIDVMLHEQKGIEVGNAKDTYPVYLLLDELTDPQNVGAIIRTAYFMGVTGVVLSKRNCASLTPVAVKAASGATEFLPIFYTNSSVSFIRQSQKHGWTCVATVSPKENMAKERLVTLGNLSTLNKKGPVIYVFGSESKGLRVLVKRECLRTTTVPGAKHINPIVDSLNVAVSVASILTSMISRS